LECDLPFAKASNPELKRGKDMVTPEEARVLTYLREHRTAVAADHPRSCLPGSPGPLLVRNLSNLEWLGYLVAYYDHRGEPVAVQLTPQGYGSTGQLSFGQ
jgi:hypothetical protein